MINGLKYIDLVGLWIRIRLSGSESNLNYPGPDLDPQPCWKETYGFDFACIDDGLYMNGDR